MFTCPDPIRGGDNILVLCEVLQRRRHEAAPDQHPGRRCEKVAKKYAKQEMIFGIEQEYTMLKLDGTPLGFPDGGGFPGPQGPYYCGVGTGRVIGREIIEEHTQACIDAGLMIEGTNAEVMPGQWEFQIGAADALDGQRPPVRRPLAAAPHRRGLRRRRSASPPSRRRATGTAPARTPTSPPRRCARATTPIEAACKAIGKKVELHVKGYGARHREPPHRRARDRPVQQVQLRRVQPRRLDPHPVAGRQGRQGLRRGPSPQRQLRPVHRHPPDHSRRVCGAALSHASPTRQWRIVGLPGPPSVLRFRHTVDRPDWRDDQCSNSNVTTCCTPWRSAASASIRLWFTDVLGNLKSFAISPAELENALEDGMTFDGSSIDGFSRIQESDVLAIPDPNTFEVLPWGDPKAPEARVFCDIHNLDGTPFEGDPRQVLRRNLAGRARARASRSSSPPTSSSSTSPRRRRARRPMPLDEGGFFDLTTSDVAGIAAQADDPHARDDGHPGRVQLPRGRARASTRSTCATPTR